MLQIKSMIGGMPQELTVQREEVYSPSSCLHFSKASSVA